jgi:hypothetical protein
MFGIRRTLRAGSMTFGASAVLLLLAPSFFLDLLDLDKGNESLVWSMRMIGITLVALAGNMWANASSSNDSRIRFVGKVMALSATTLGVLTLVIPTSLNWFSIAYAAIGFAFGINYLLCLARRKH